MCCSERTRLLRSLRSVGSRRLESYTRLTSGTGSLGCELAHRREELEYSAERVTRAPARARAPQGDLTDAAAAALTDSAAAVTLGPAAVAATTLATATHATAALALAAASLAHAAAASAAALLDPRRAPVRCACCVVL